MQAAAAPHWGHNSGVADAEKDTATVEGTIQGEWDRSKGAQDVVGSHSFRGRKVVVAGQRPQSWW